MEHSEDIKAILGKDNINFFLAEVNDGKIDPNTLKKIFVSMGHGVHGVFKEKLEKCEKMADVVCYCLDRWFATKECKFNRFKEILGEYDGLKYLCEHLSPPLQKSAILINNDRKKLLIFGKKGAGKSSLCTV